MRALLLLLLCLPPAACTSGDARDQEKIELSIEEGRRLLDERKPEEAQALFEEAERLDDSDLRSRMWVLRSWMDQGRSNDTLDALDALTRDGHAGPEMDYLYGMAFVRRAEGHIASGVTDTSIRINFMEAVEALAKAVAADEERFRDALQPLAKAAWYSQDLEQARAAAERAIVFYPEDGEAWLTLGRVSLSQFRAAQEEEAWSQAAFDHWNRAREAFARSIETLADPAETYSRMLLAQSALQLGHTHVLRKEREEAVGAYALAVAWAPQALDYREIRGLLAGDEEGAAASPLFNRVLEDGTARFRATYGEDDPRLASLVWWLAYSRYETERYADAEAAFVEALERNPDAVNSWYFVAMARYHVENPDGAIEAIKAGWDADPSDIVATTTDAPESSVLAFEHLIGWANGRERFADCALLAEICAETLVHDARHWNNMGYFVRREGLRREGKDEEGNPVADPVEPADPELLTKLYELSYSAYSRALRIASDDPQLVNDTAVILHYDLGRDLDTAMQMYSRAEALAERRLAEPDLSPDDRARFEKAKADAEKNRRHLDELMRREAQKNE